MIILPANVIKRLELQSPDKRSQSLVWLPRDPKGEDIARGKGTVFFYFPGKVDFCDIFDQIE